MKQFVESATRRNRTNCDFVRVECSLQNSVYARRHPWPIKGLTCTVMKQMSLKNSRNRTKCWWSSYLVLCTDLCDKNMTLIISSVFKSQIKCQKHFVSYVSEWGNDCAIKIFEQNTGFAPEQPRCADSRLILGSHPVNTTAAKCEETSGEATAQVSVRWLQG